VLGSPDPGWLTLGFATGSCWLWKANPPLKLPGADGPYVSVMTKLACVARGLKPQPEVGGPLVPMLSSYSVRVGSSSPTRWVALFGRWLLRSYVVFDGLLGSAMPLRQRKKSAVPEGRTALTSSSAAGLRECNCGLVTKVRKWKLLDKTEGQDYTGKDAVEGSIRGGVAMVRVTVLYDQPEDKAKFDRYFKETHVQKAIKAPGIERIESSTIKSAGDGSASPYYRITEVYFPTDSDFQAFLNSSEGKEALGDLDNFAKGRYTMLIGEVDSVTEKTPARAGTRS